MRKYLIIILGCMYFSVSSGQSLVDQIEHAYSTLDSTSYIDDVILSYAKSFAEMDKGTSDIFKLTRSDSLILEGVLKSNNVDDICSMYSQYSHNYRRTQWINEFRTDVKSRIPIYILNLKLKNDQTLQVDTGKLKFNLFYFGKKYKKGLYVYCYNGEYSCHDTYYPTFSTKIAHNVPKVFKRIMRKHPKYLLLCSDLEGANSILYVLNNEIYIYKIVQMKEYKLDYYMKHRASIDIWK